MEKELLELNFKNLNLNFYYQSNLVKKSELADYQKWLRFALEAFHSFSQLKKDLWINLSLIDDEEMIEINSEHRGKEKVTDVLSFPMQDNIRAGDYDDFMEELEVGDILICKSVCEKQAKEFELSYMEEFVHLFVHGFLHVWGYDHEIDEEEEKLMFGLEEKLMLKISKIKKAGS
jgi:rRNA maturation RNase YbeY